MSYVASLIFNISLHCIILFSFLSIFYWNYILDEETNAINELIEDNLFNKIHDFLIKKSVQIDMAKNLLQSNPDTNQLLPMTKIPIKKALYQENKIQNELFNNNHDKYKLINLSIGLVLYIIFILIVFYLVYNGYKIDYNVIIIENIILIILIGLIEAIFFTFIAKKYVPLTDSDIKTFAINILKNI